MAYITYAEYQSLGGKAKIENFALLQLEACAYIDRYTFGRVAKDFSISEPSYAENLRGAMTALINLLDGNDGGREISSMSNNGISVTYADGASIERTTGEIIRRYLGCHKDMQGVPLCYVGV